MSLIQLPPVIVRSVNIQNVKDALKDLFGVECVKECSFEEQNIAVETKIRLEKDDVKNLLERKMNEVRLPSQYANQMRQRQQHQAPPRPQTQPPLRPQPPPQHQGAPPPPPPPQRQQPPPSARQYHYAQRPPHHSNFSSRMSMGGLSK